MRVLLVFLLGIAYSLNSTASELRSIKHGAELFMNYCVGCHSLKYVSYDKMVVDLELNAKHFEFFVKDNLLVPSLDQEDAQHWLGQVPPDLSLIARSRGSWWLEAYLKGFYVDTTLPFGVNNVMLPKLHMPHVLWSLQSTLTTQEYNQTITDLVSFLSYTADPTQLVRYRIGIFVMAFWAIFVLVWLFVLFGK